MLLNKQWVIKEINDEMEKYLETNEYRIWHTKMYWVQQKHFWEGSSYQYSPTSRNKKNFK